MDKGLFSLLAFVLLGLTVLFFLRGTFRAFQFIVAGSMRLQLHAPNGEPTLHVEALLFVTNPVTLRLKREAFRLFLEDQASRPECAGLYGPLMDEIESALAEYRGRNADDDEADIVLGAMRLRQKVEACLMKHMGPRLAPFGVRVGGVSKCAIGTLPPQVKPPNAHPVPV